jgi:pilus assembly protein CpaF
MSFDFQLVVQGDGASDDQVIPIVGDTVRIGREQGNEIVLPSPFVSRHHASLARRGDRLWLRSEGLNPTIVNERELQPATETEVVAGDSIVIQGFFLRVQRSDRAPVVTDDDARAGFMALIAGLHESVINRLDPRVFRIESVRSEEGRQAARRELRAALDALPLGGDPAALAFGAREALRTTLLLGLLGQSASAADAEPFGQAREYAAGEQARLWLVGRLAQTLGIALDGAAADSGIRTLREGFEPAFQVWRAHITPDIAEHLTRWILRKEVGDLIFGLGPLTDLLRMPDVNEIMVVSKDQIYIEHNKTLEETGRTFGSDRVSEQILERILGPINRRVDRSSPMVDARLPDGSRVNAVIPPLALKGPCITIRRFSRDPLTIDDLIAFGALTPQVASFLRACVKGRKNIVISGGTGSGKTTLLNALSGWIPSGERIVTIEDTAELRLQQRHVVTLESRPANVEQRGEVTIRDLLRNALRMRPDRIIVGECRGREALDMLQAMNTGHEGSMTTGHANAPEDMLRRLEVMVLEAAPLPLAAVRRQIVSGIDLVIQQSRLRDGSRCVTYVTEIVDVDDLTGEVIAEDVFVRRADGQLAFTGYLPTFVNALVQASYLSPSDAFLPC